MPKFITVALGSLQRLIALRDVSLSATPAIIQTMNKPISQGVDIHLKIFQTLLSLITNFPPFTAGCLQTYVLCSVQLFFFLDRWANDMCSFCVSSCMSQ